MISDNICKFITQSATETLTTHGFVLEGQCPASGQQRTDRYHTVYLTVQGSGRLTQGGHTHALSAGTLFFTFADVPYVIENTDELQYLYITFSGGRGEELMRRFDIRPEHCLWEGYGHLVPLWQDSLMRADAQNIDLLSESILLYTLSKLKGAQNVPKDFARRTLSFLEQHFTDSELSLHVVAEALGYNEKYLSHAFKKQFGMTFSGYLRLMRIKHAVLLMENGVTSVKNVAFLSGFSDPLYFSKVFSHEMGCSPKAYLADLHSQNEH